MSVQHAKIIAVDPSFRKRGLGVCILNEGALTFLTFDKFVDFIYHFIVNDYSEYLAIVENSNLQNVTFLKGIREKNVAMRRSRDAGKNQAVSEIAIDILERECSRVVGISPKQKGAKITNDGFLLSILRSHKISVKEKRLNQDKRDAVQLLIKALSKNERREKEHT